MKLTMIFVLLIFVLIGLSNGAENVCRFPKRWKRYLFKFILKEKRFFFVLFLFSNYDFNYKKRLHEWATLNAKTDYYKLVLSWSPTFCKQLPSNHRNQTFQCQYDDFGLVV